MNILKDLSKNATVVKARAMYGNRLKYEHYKELLNKKSVNEVAEYLKKNTHYSEILQNINTDIIHRGFLEDLIKKHFYQKYEKITRFQLLHKDGFYKYLVKIGEIREILTSVMLLNAGLNEDHISTIPSYLIDKSSFDLLALARIKSLEELLLVIENTPYYDIVKSVKIINKKIDFLSCEVMLRTHYIKWLLDVVNKDFDKNSQNILLKQIHVHIDLINLINSYRMKKYFNATADEIQQNMLPFYGRMTRKKQLDLYQAKDIDEFVSILNKTVYGNQMVDSNKDVYFEWKLTKLRYRLAKRSLMFSENPAVSIYSLLYLFEIENENITNIIEGIRYKRDISYIENLLVYD